MHAHISATLVAGNERFPLRIASDSTRGFLGTGVILLDLDNVTFIDSTALGTILKAAAQLDEAGTLLAVVAPEGPVRKLLEMTNLTQRFRLFTTRAAALEADGAPA